MLKIYPCLVVEGTALYGQWKRREYEPYDAAQATELIAKATRYIPRYCRVMRMQRDIPVQLIAAGVKKSNLTQLVERRLAARGGRCNCIRCREIGHRMLRGEAFDGDGAMLSAMRYAASGGTELFLSFDDAHDALVAFARLRLCANAFVRELRVYGEALALGERKAAAQQHGGYGARLLAEAERIARESGYGKLLVTSGVGAREYYRKRGYERDGFYMAKTLKGERWMDEA
jgi:elongator complex protein 3